MNRALVALVVLGLALLACSGMGDLVVTVTPAPTNAPTETELVALVTPSATPEIPTETPNASPTPELVGVSTCTVSANVAVWMRPSPSTENYPIVELPNGTLVEDLGGKSGDWLFLRWEDKEGWVRSGYVECQ